MSSYLDLKAKRTEAVAPRSLFGTNVEILQPGETQQNLPKKQKQKRPIGLEKFAKYRQPGDVEMIEGTKIDYKRQWDSTCDAKDQYKEVQENALYFKPDYHTLGDHSVRDQFRPVHITDKNPYKTDVKLSATDIAHPELFNFGVGLGSRQDYNYDAYRDPRLRNNSNYKHTGNVLGKHGQLASHKNSRTGKGVTANPGQGEYHSPIVQSSGRPAQQSANSEAVPSNIRHKYGTQMISDMIGSDKKTVSEAIETVRTPVPRARTTHEEKHEKNEKRLSPGYECLSNHLRYDHFSGVPLTGLKSLNTESYTNEVFRRSAAPYPPKHAILKNEDSNWAEQNVLQHRIKKAWTNFMDSQPKPEVNWDRNKKREKPPPQEQPKPKPKPPKPKAAPPKEPPPKEPTPPPQPPPKDDAFWDFYDKGV